MNLDELQSPMTSVQLAKLLKKQHGIAIPVDRLSRQQAHHMLESVQTKINRFRNTTAAHVSEQNSQYTAMLMVEQVLTTRISEGVWDKAKGLAKATGAQLKPIGQSFVDAGKKIAHHAGLDVGLPAGSARIRKAASDDTTEKPDSGESSSVTFDKMVGALASSVRPRISATTLDKMIRNPKANPNLGDVLVSALYNMQRYGITESRYIAESAMGEAEVILAAKDLADRIQDMVETIGKMVNEELPALTETVRDTMDAERADAFNASALETLNGALEAVRGTKDSLDAAARTLAGEEAAEPFHRGVR